MTSNKEKFILELNKFNDMESNQKVNADALTEEKSLVKAQGVVMADALYAAIIAKEVTAEFFEGLPKPSRTAQGYISKARKVGFAVLEKTFTVPEGMSLMRAYDVLLESQKVQKENLKLVSQNAARDMAALKMACDDDIGEVNRLLNQGGEELHNAYSTGRALLAEIEAKNLAEEKAANMAKLVTETKANLLVIQGTDFWNEILDYVTEIEHPRNTHKAASAA